MVATGEFNILLVLEAPARENASADAAADARGGVFAGRRAFDFLLEILRPSSGAGNCDVGVIIILDAEIHSGDEFSTLAMSALGAVADISNCRILPLLEGLCIIRCG